MICKNCNAELEDGVLVCPECGEAAAEPEKRSKTKVWQIVLASLGALVLLLVLTVAVYWSIIGVESFDEGIQSIVSIFSPRENDVYYKDSYSVSDKKAVKQHDVVVATVGGKELTNGLLQVYYWDNVYKFLEDYGYSAIYMGLDYTEPLDEQQHPNSEGTWQHYFLQDALTSWHSYQAMALMAQDNDLQLNESMRTYLNQLYQTLYTAAIQGGYGSVDALIQADMGPGCTYDDYYARMEIYCTGYMYYTMMYEKIDTSDEAIAAYFTANEAALKQSGITKTSGNLFNVRHILIQPEGEEDATTYTDEQWEECREKAQKLLDDWLAGEATEENFSKLATERSADGGSKDNGGLYTGLNKDTEFVKEFVDWYMAEGRKVGDYGLIKTSYGYHIMYCSEIEAEWISACRDGLLSDGAHEIIRNAMNRYPLEVNYKKIALGVANLDK